VLWSRRCCGVGGGVKDGGLQHAHGGFLAPERLLETLCGVGGEELFAGFYGHAGGGVFN